MDLNWLPWHHRVQNAQERTTRVEVETERIERDMAVKYRRAEVATSRVEQAAIQVLRDHESVMEVAARERGRNG